MTLDLPTLRKHEAALGEAMSSNRIYMRKLDDADERAYWQGQQDALDYALSRLREEIARAEDAEARIAAQCPSCAGSGEQISWSSLRDYDRCRACNGTGKRPTEVT